MCREYVKATRSQQHRAMVSSTLLLLQGLRNLEYTIYGMMDLTFAAMAVLDACMSTV